MASDCFNFILRLLGKSIYSTTTNIYHSKLYFWRTHCLSISKTKIRCNKVLLSIAIITNLLVLGYYKYANFFITDVGALIGFEADFKQVILPLGISFFTFTQIAFLVDAYQGKVKETNFIHYTLFVTYFPHLIAGPILHHRDMIPQFTDHSIYRFKLENLNIGLTFFVIGLFKKTVLADGIGAYVPATFDQTAQTTLTMLNAWIGALAYTCTAIF